MTTTENPTINVEMPAIKPAEIISDSDNLRIARLSFSGNSRNGGYGIQEEIAELGAGGVTLHYIQTNKKSKQFVLLAEEMDTLATEWLKFRHDYFERIAREKAEHEAELAERLFQCKERAEAYGGTIEVSGRGSFGDYYRLTFPKGSAWSGHWTQEYGLSLSDIEERLDIIRELEAQKQAHAAEMRERLEKCLAKAKVYGIIIDVTGSAAGSHTLYSVTFPEGFEPHVVGRRHDLRLHEVENCLDAIDRHKAQEKAKNDH